MNSCVFDIETAPGPDADISPALVEKLKASEGQDWRNLLAVYAPAARVVTIAMLNLDNSTGQILVDNEHGPLDGFDAPHGTRFQVIQSDETRMLREFWKIVTTYDRVITYSGRRFDVPFLMQRSLVRQVQISVDLVPPRTRQPTNHLDLADVLSLYGATRPFGLAVWTETIGHPSPKGGEVQGANVGAAFAEGRVRAIAEYCARDVVATAALARRVLEHWGPLLG